MAPHDRQDTPTSEPPFFVVLNKGSGHQTAADDIARINDAMRRSHKRCEIATIASGESLAQVTGRMSEQAAAEGGVLVAAGGDGTLREVAQAALGKRLRFGALPSGTFNYFGRTHGIPLDVDASVAALLAGVERPVQAGLVNDKVFLVNASVGLYPELLEDRESLKHRLGRSRPVALLAALTTLFRDHRALTLEIVHEGERQVVETASLFVGNSPMQMELIGVDEADVTREGRLSAIVVKALSRFDLARVAMRGALGQLGSAEGVDTFAFGEMIVRPRGRYARRSIKVAMDGEVTRMTLPLRFRVAPEPLRLFIAPQASPAES